MSWTRRMLNWLRGGPADGAAAALARRIGGALQRHLYEAAAAPRAYAKQWRGAASSHIDSQLGPSLQTLRQRARYAGANSGYARGIVETYRADFIGKTGPKLQVHSGQEGFSSRAEALWRDWCEVADAAGRLHLVELLGLAIEGHFFDGEALLQKVNAAPRGAALGRRPLPVRLRLLTIAPERLGDPLTGAETVRNGVELDRDGRPLAYWICGGHPQDGQRGARLDYQRVPAAQMLHLYRTHQAGQTRGEPWLAPVLNIFEQLRAYTADVLLAARIAAMLAVFIRSNNAEATFDNLKGELPVFDLESGTASFLPAGWDIQQVTPQQPSARYAELKRELLSEIGRPFCMPLLKGLLTAERHNYSSARVDISNNYLRALRDEQGRFERGMLSPLAREVIAEGLLGGAFDDVALPDDWDLEWIWEPLPAVDVVKEAAAAQTRLAAGLTNLRDEIPGDVGEHLRTRARERALMRELGLSDAGGAPAPPSAAALEDEPAAVGADAEAEEDDL